MRKKVKLRLCKNDPFGMKHKIFMLRLEHHLKADNKSSALEKAKEKVARYGGNYNVSDAKVIKKCKK